MAQQECPTFPPDYSATHQGWRCFYLKGDYEAARLLSPTPGNSHSRRPRTIRALRHLKRLTSVRAAAGEFADADNWLQQAITWRENTLGRKDPRFPTTC